jgi:predicted DNA-binding WGR domain protein
LYTPSTSLFDEETVLSQIERNTGRYELKNGLDHKFWEGTVEGKAVTLRFGKVGTTGLRASREFASVDSAKEFLKMRLQQKIREGYKPVGSIPTGEEA